MTYGVVVVESQLELAGYLQVLFGMLWVEKNLL